MRRKNLVFPRVVGALGLAAVLTAAFAAAEDTGPADESALREQALEEYAYHWGVLAYVWGWPAVNLHNRRESDRPVPEPGRDGGVLPAAPINYICFLTDYLAADQREIVTPNQDTVYGSGFADLGVEPVVFQVPDFGGRYWILHVMDAYTNVVATLGSRENSKPGFYLLVGPAWKGDAPAGIAGVFRSSTNFAWYIPRVFMNDTAEDRAAIQPYLHQMNIYPLSEYDGEMKNVDWTKVPDFPAEETGDVPGEVRWVKDEVFWEDFAAVLAENAPVPAEAAMWGNFQRLLAQRETSPAVKRGLDRAVADGSKIVAAGFPYSNQMDQVGYGWAGDLKGGKWGDEYLRRAWVGKAYIAVNEPADAFYVGTDLDETGASLNGKYAYTVTFPRGQLPPARAFWSLTLYDYEHFFAPNALQRYSVGTKNLDRMKFDADGSLTLYLQHQSPGKDKEENWLPAPADGHFAVLLRYYVPKESVLQGEYAPPPVKRVE